jgi:nuclear pore complex protein Nup62
VQSAQTNLVSTLDYIESQQTQLDKELDQFETKLQSVLQANPAQKKLSTITASPYTGMSAEEERERTFELAETLNSELSHLNQNINETIESVNKLWKKSSSGGVLTGQEGDQTVKLLLPYFPLKNFNYTDGIDDKNFE